MAFGIDDLLGGLALSAAGSAMKLGTDTIMQNQAKETNVDLWKKQNEYNSPVQQMARLNAAGLNPALVYGKGATALGGDIAPVRPVEVENPIGNLGKYQEIRNLEEQRENVIASRELTNAQTDKVRSEKTAVDLQNTLQGLEINALSKMNQNPFNLTVGPKSSILERGLGFLSTPLGGLWNKGFGLAGSIAERLPMAWDSLGKKIKQADIDMKKTTVGHNYGKGEEVYYDK